MLVLCVLVMGSGLLTGCDPEKARAIQGAAAQFRTESFAAIQAIDDMRRKELEPPQRASADIRRDFIIGILNSKHELTSDVIDLALDPYQPPPDPQWDSFMDDLRGQYENFAAIFDKLDTGSLVGVNDVRQSAEHAKSLTVQMALFADAINKNPPVLYRYRNTLIVKLRKQRQAYQDLVAQIKYNYGSVDASPQSTRDKLRDIETQVGESMDAWQQVRLQEQQLLQVTVAQCLKAALLGKELGQLINQYDKLDLRDINALIPRILSTAAAITGRDYGALRLKAASVIGEIQTDPLWRDAANSALNRVVNAATKRIQAQPDPKK
jgi:hypothetical protein